MIKVENAEQHLKTIIDGNKDDIQKVWEAFKAFGKVKIDGEEETALLFQCGVYDFTGEELFYYDFVRQFTLEEDGHMEQLHCEFVFALQPELRKLEASEWFFDDEGDIEDFYTEIEKLDAFQLPLKRKPLCLNIYQEEV